MPATPADRQRRHIEERLRAALAGRYEIDGELGRGGMAMVYRAHDLRHDRLVAVKILPPELATTIAAERFLFEIRTAAKLVHPHILSLFDSGEADGILYYVMPHVEGESLRARLAREHHLPIAEAARIVHEVASALDHAHANGIVHRDIKPENILLVGGTHAMVADFGLARAILRSTEAGLTGSRHIVGTVHYMSPEQAGAITGEVDERSDLYSLGCVLFELLAGRPPFDAEHDLAVIGLHLREPPPLLRSIRPDVPVSVEQLVDGLLQKDPAKRPQSAAELSAELGRALSGDSPPWYRIGPLGGGPPLGRRGLGSGLVAVGVVAAVMGIVSLAAISPFGAPVRHRVSTWWSPALDSTRYVVLPFRQGRGASADLAPELQLQDAFARWNGLTVVDHLQIADAFARSDSTGFDVRRARDLAESFGGGRLVWGDVAAIGDSLRLHVTLYDTRTGNTLSEATVKLPRDSAGADDRYQQLADELLFRGSERGAHVESSAGTSSFAARSAFLHGQMALQRWDLASAASSFAQAIALDSRYAAAFYWLAQLRSWSADDPQEWRTLANNAVLFSNQLPERERTLAAALQRMADGQYPQACALYEALRAQDPQDFAAAYGLGECLRRDNVVVRDARSPSGWRFRASRFRAMNAYREALEMLPSIHKAFGARAFERLRGILMTAAAMRVEGRALPPDTGTFRAAPTWAGDSLVLIPFAPQDEMSERALAVAATTVDAINHQREMFRDVAASWRRSFPDDVAPREAMAVALELLGNPTALDTLQEARRLATTEEQRFGLAWEEVWLRTKFSVPDNLANLEAARGLADSLLGGAQTAPPGFADRLASLAVLTGKADLAAWLVRRAEENAPQQVPVPLRTSMAARALLVYAAVGAPLESLRTLEPRVAADIAAMTPVDRRRTTLSTLLGQPAGLSFPVYRFTSLTRLAGEGNPLLDAQLAFARGDTALARRIFDERRRARATLRPADLTLDITYPAAWTLLALGDRASAIAWLDPVLNAAPMYPPQSLSRIANAGALVRGMLLRARLAQEAGDAVTAQRWTRAAAVLWRDADPSLRR